MPIHFDLHRMDAVIENHERWWRGELGRPLIRTVVSDIYPAAATAKGPQLAQENCHELDRPAEDVIAAADDWLSTCEFMADGYPVMSFDCFGPGLLAAFCGSKLDNSSGRVWFLPAEPDVTKLHVSYDPENPWSRRIKELYRAGLERWEGNVIMTLPDIGGVLDVLSSLCGAESLIYALVDEPEHVHRLIGEIQTAWYDAYEDFTRVLAPQGVYTDWNGILSREPSYIPQCDFSYMLGPDMFREFVLETLRTDTKRLKNTIYHLDGVAQLKHLDQILSLEDLRAVQWVYGVGQPGPTAWRHVYRKILDAGKQVMIIDNALHNDFLEVLPDLGPSPLTCIWATKQDLPQVLRILQAAGVA